MTSMFQVVATRAFEEWRDCIHTRARIVNALRSARGARADGLAALERYFDGRARLLWRRFRVAYARVVVTRRISAI